MAWGGTRVYIYNKAGTSYVLQNNGTNNYMVNVNSYKISDLLSNYSNSGVTAVSLSLGGIALDPNSTASSWGVEEGDTYLYDVTPIPEVTGFFLDGPEYKIGGDEAAWGNISGTISDQTDLQTALNAKANSTDILTKTNTTAFTPTGDYNPATKKYVDDNKTEYNAGEGIEIGNIQDYSAMQGPAPDGFHVPLTTEWNAVKNIWTALGGGSKDGTNFGIALKLPFAGFRVYSSAVVNSQGSGGYYWSSTAYTSNACRLYFSSTTINTHNTDYRVSGFSVRCFKNTPVIPTSSWTKLYGTSIEAGGIFWSSADGLISLSSDGQTWVTIADKNLGATTVWNSGDTLSEANMGNMYQWGNNYGFPSTGTISNTSSTQVDASNYGPGNYYSSDTFITRSSSPYSWDSTNNGNLWGGETGIITLDNAITNTGVLSVNGQTGDVTIQEPNVIAVTQAEYEALSEATKNDGKLRIISDAPEIEIPIPDDTAFGSSWDGDTTHAPSKNAVYDAIGNIETLLAAI